MSGFSASIRQYQNHDAAVEWMSSDDIGFELVDQEAERVENHK